MRKTLKQLYEVINSGRISLEDAVDFINIVFPICEGRQPNETTTMKAFQLGYGDPIIKFYMNKIHEDPSKFGLTIITIKDKNGTILRNTVNEINSTI